MKEEKSKQDQLDELHRRQYELEHKISDNVKNMNELSAKNPTDYNFLKSLNGDIENDKGGNYNEYTDFKE
ncbi:Uncharacterised protein [Streptococcus cristatus]|uniref:Uncharacterized protein n=2 Tax=Streptococcus cristatus TaxID=45634 RepID=A0A512A990_STRCR|nr:hypothetical protein [Streptococcus cristatus]AGK70937.1 hypothetical protein I872_04215 [Streptococcus cristatus AS 1.3089]GEN96249.1 hypothetical protein SOL01_01230 [Streptococcus cristatus]SQI47436.1 Uncharacterised protein [Streptococcus cristatus]